MINPQFTYDHAGNKVGVFLAIADWDQLQQIPEVNELAEVAINIPEWQVELVKKELQNIADGNADLLSWEETKQQFKL